MNKREKARKERHELLKLNHLEARYDMTGHIQRLFFFGFPDSLQLTTELVSSMTVAYQNREWCFRCKRRNGFTVHAGRLVFLMQCHNPEAIAIAMHEAIAEICQLDLDLVFETGHNLPLGRKKSFHHRVGNTLCTIVSQTSKQSRSRIYGRNRWFDPDQLPLMDALTYDGDG